LGPQALASIIQLADEGKINFSIAAARLLPHMIETRSTDAFTDATHLNLMQVSDGNEIENWVQQVIDKMPDKVAEYRKGKKGLIGLFVGEVKKLSKGKADPKMATQILEEKLSK